MAQHSLPHDNRLRAFSLVALTAIAALMAFLLAALVHSNAAR